MTSSSIRNLLRRAAAVTAAAAAILLASTLAAAPEPTETGSQIRAMLAAGTLPGGLVVEIVPLRRFYQQRSYQPAWNGSAAASVEAHEMLSALEHSADDGLEPTDYRIGALLHPASSSPLDTAEYDLLFSDAALRFARDLRTGRSQLRSLDRDVDLPSQAFDSGASLNAALESNTLGAFLTSLAPPHRQYRSLKGALLHYRQIAAHGDWPSLSRSSSNEEVKSRLWLEDDASAGDLLLQALKRFQSQHGLPPDGRLGDTTLKALNVSASERAMQVVANMERWRWLPRVLEASYVAVNAPDQHLAVTGPGSLVLESRVIVGRPSDPTPIFRAVATSVTVNPPWNVPDAIARREILPKLRKNPRYLIEHDMVLRDGHIQQRPGPKNALGSLKLELPNRFNVYLHYTSARSLFALDSRALSHGCVRVEQILPLASYALARNPASAVSSLQSAIASGTTQHIRMANPLPVYFLYWTAFADPDGTIEFRPDIYGRDQRMFAAIENRAANQRVAMNNMVDCAPA